MHESNVGVFTLAISVDSVIVVKCLTESGGKKPSSFTSSLPPCWVVSNAVIMVVTHCFSYSFVNSIHILMFVKHH
jgi:hypothetical protein